MPIADLAAWQYNHLKIIPEYKTLTQVNISENGRKCGSEKIRHTNNRNLYPYIQDVFPTPALVHAAATVLSGTAQ